ncbi:unnamed protein product [Hermetia illucens]|uniref:Uncharacterized protein n=1 Tax=Hermetia illucens TaxID=343691 RepID=A0A7R8UM57_HERIL|nr:cell wall protein DAN4 [Hermetia illucens]CAD7083243.1 unnamed protein product [Hermetia illucens]
MLKLWNFIGLVFLVWGVCSALDSDEYATGESLDGSSLDVYRYTVLDPERYEDASSQEDDVRKKRESATTRQSTEGEAAASVEPSPAPRVNLDELIGRVEGSFVQSALSVVSFVVTQNSTNAPNSTDKDKDEISQNHKRSAFSTDEVASDQDTIFKYVTTRSIPASEDQPPHYIVDEVAVSKGRSAITPLIASLDFHVEKIHESTVSSTPSTLKDGDIQESSNSALTVGKVIVDDVKVTTFVTPIHAAESTTPSSLSKSTTSEPAEVVEITPKTSTTEASISSASIPKEIPSAPSSSTTSSTPNTSSSTTTASSLPASTSVSPASASPSTAEATSSTTSSTPTSTSTKTPIEKLKEAEEDLKEKVAEIEAEPIILSARV